MSRGEHSIGRNALFLIGGRVLGGLAALATVALLTRNLTLQEFGLYSYALALLNLLRVLVGFGGNDVATAEIARAPERRSETLGALLSLRTLGALSCALAFAALVSAGAPQARGALLLGAPFLLFSAGKALDPALQAERRFGVIASARLLGQLAVLVVVGACVLTESLTLSAAVLAAAAGPALAQLVVTVRALRVVRPAWSWSPRPGLAFLRRSWPQALATVCGLVTFHVDTLMLHHLEGSLETAVYGAAYRVFAFAVAIPTLFAAPLLPEMARDVSTRRSLFARGLATVLGGGVLAAAVMYAVAPLVLRLLADDPPYEASTDVLRLLFVALIGFGATSVAGAALVAAGRSGRWAAVALAALVLNLVLNVLWIPRHGALGAAQATLVTELVAAVLAVLAARRV